MQTAHETIPSSAREGSPAPGALWNPLAAAGWSLVFTPAFGAYLQMRNWQALGEPGQAAIARKWLYASLAILLADMLAAALDARLNNESHAMHWIGFTFLGLWTIGAAWPQARLVRKRYGAAYPRKPWDHALIGAVAAATAYAGASALLAFVFVSLT